MASIAIPVIHYILRTIFTITSQLCKATSRIFQTSILIPFQMMSLFVSKLCFADFSWLCGRICPQRKYPIMITVGNVTRTACRALASSIYGALLSKRNTHTRSFHSTTKYILVRLLKRFLVALLLAKYIGLHIVGRLVRMKRGGTPTLEHKGKFERKDRKDTNFMNLPRELRDQIYMHCFCAGKVYPYAHAVSNPIGLFPFLIFHVPGIQSSEARLMFVLIRSETLTQDKSTALSLQPLDAQIPLFKPSPRTPRLATCCPWPFC